MNKSTRVSRRRSSGRKSEPKEVRHIEDAIPRKNTFGNMRVSRFPGIGFPDELRTVLKYNEIITFQTVIEPSAQVYQINSLFDPNVSLGGHQPSYFDKLAAVYGKYLVTSAKVHCEITNLAGATAHFVAGAYTAGTTAINTQSIAELPYSMDKTVGFATGAGNVSMDFPVMNIARLTGQSDIASDPDMYSAVTTNPVNQVYFVFRATGLGGNNCFLDVSFTIYFDCIFKDLNPEDPSLTTPLVRDQSSPPLQLQSKVALDPRRARGVKA